MLRYLLRERLQPQISVGARSLRLSPEKAEVPFGLRHVNPESIKRLRNSIRDKVQIPEIMSLDRKEQRISFVKVMDYRNDMPDRIVLFIGSWRYPPFMLIPNLEASGFTVLADMIPQEKRLRRLIYGNDFLIEIPSHKGTSEWADDPFDPNSPDSKESVFDIDFWYKQREPEIEFDPPAPQDNAIPWGPKQGAEDGEEEDPEDAFFRALLAER